MADSSKQFATFKKKCHVYFTQNHRSINFVAGNLKLWLHPNICLETGSILHGSLNKVSTTDLLWPTLCFYCFSNVLPLCHIWLEGYCYHLHCLSGRLFIFIWSIVWKLHLATTLYFKGHQASINTYALSGHVDLLTFTLEIMTFTLHILFGPLQGKYRWRPRNIFRVYQTNIESIWGRM